MRTLALIAIVAAAAPAAAQHQHAAQDAAHHAEHASPAGWEFRLDRANADRNAVHFMQMGNGLHFHPGPAAIFYNPSHNRSGAYRVSATFNQTRAPEHPEAYGLFFGAHNLDQDDQDYMYFLVRGGGQFTVKHRAGNDVHTIVDWTDNAAIHRHDTDGKASNELSVDVSPEAITYFVNGTQEHRSDRAAAGHPINTDGTYGLSVNLNLDVHVEGPQITAR